MKGICASSWIITKNHCMMHGQQNVKAKLVVVFRRNIYLYRFKHNGVASIKIYFLHNNAPLELITSWMDPLHICSIFQLHLDPNTEYLVNIVESGFFIQTICTPTDHDLLCMWYSDNSCSNFNPDSRYFW